MTSLSALQYQLPGSIRLAILTLLMVVGAMSTRGLGQDDWRHSGFVDRRTDSLFDTKVLSYRLRGDQVGISYRLHIPEDARSEANPKQGWPLLVWLHGFGEAGEDNREHLRWMNLLFGNNQFPGFVMAYQCPIERPTWADGIRQEEQPMTIARAIIDELSAVYSIDTNRIYVSGVSSGGTGCWQMMLRYPELFAAAVPIASSGAGPVDLRPISHIPIWAFHTREDPEIPLIHVRSTVEQLQKMKGKAYLTETIGYTHNCWSAAFGEFQFINWLLTQRKGGTNSPPKYWTASHALGLALQPLKQAGVQYYLPIPFVALISWYAWRKAKHVSNSTGQQSAQVST